MGGKFKPRQLAGGARFPERKRSDKFNRKGNGRGRYANRGNRDCARSDSRVQ